MDAIEAVKNFLRPPNEGGIYSDASLKKVLGHAQSGQLCYFSCCCFAGIPTARHELKGEMLPRFSIMEGYRSGHHEDLFPSSDWVLASMAFLNLGETDEERRAALIPLIQAEISRRESSRSEIVMV